MDARKNKLWLISWVDSRTDTTSWTFYDRVEKPDPIIVESAGYIVRRSRKAIALAQNRTIDNDQYSHILIIPTKCILKRRRLR